jgi:signal peptidase II
MLKSKLSQLPWKWLAISMGLATIDQVTKLWIIQNLYPRETIPILPWLVLHLCYNPGIGFSLLVNAGSVLILMTTISIIYIVQKLYHSQKINHSPFLSLGFSFILGGGIGNLYDRFKLGAVIDFIGIYFFQWKLPVFNLADVFINIGFLIIILSELILQLNSRRVS